MTTKETSAYIKGLIDGTGLDKTTPEGKIIAALADLCGVMAAEIETLTEELDVCNQYIEEIDEDLGDVEEYIYGPDDCDCEDWEDWDCDCDCDCECDCDCDDECDCDCGCEAEDAE